MKRSLFIWWVLFLALNGCSNNPEVEVRGGAGRDIYYVLGAMIPQEQYVLEFTIKNVSGRELVFNRIEEIWSFTGKEAGLSQMVLPEEGQWRLRSREERTFISETDGYTLELHDAAKGRPITFSFTLFRDDRRLLGPYTTTLPKLEELPQTDSHLLMLRNAGASPEIDLSKLPVPRLQTVTFSVK